MTILIAALLGAGVGIGVLVAIRGLRPSAEPLAATVGRLDDRGSSVAGLAVTPVGIDEALGRPQSALASVGLRVLPLVRLSDPALLSSQLRVLNKPLERHAYEKMLGAVAGFSLPLLGYLIATPQVGVDYIVPALGVAMVGSVIGFLYPDLPLHDRVAERRAGFRHALGSYLDLVTIILAGGGGVESALEGAAEGGDGWAFAELRNALRRARLTRRSPWEVLAELGDELGVTELSELAASISLAGGQGAKIKRSLTAKADAMRVAQSAAIEADAEVRTEKMIVPVVVMVLGLVLFIGFGAIQAISNSGPVVVP